ncbi:general secretion pathway protein D [Formivibrio citricus]|uniref:Type IV pilus biogenesis and competence protein PilQ n=1 Tax=Formivibrio citricus TaxID=83765 RepID=A0A1I5DD33_9NEIS|nr:pilus (MSHA type) biogenesis protein MshL [Formivibrio citricus]SFN97037.1 general secretion pathway protein D [Formivibrio citricus]
MPKSIFRRLFLASMAMILAACGAAPGLPQTAGRHTAPASPAPVGIPKPVSVAPSLPKPKSVPRTETYSVVVSKLDVHSLLFALARDARVDLDIHPGLTGEVTLNAINQTLPQILERIGGQIDMRWRMENGTLTVMPDTPYLKTYRIDYFNLARNVKSTVSIANSVDSTGGSPTGAGYTGGGNTNSSSTVIDSETQNQFWKKLETNLKEMLGIPPDNRQPALQPPLYAMGATARQAGQIARPAMSAGDINAALAIADRLTRIEKNAALAEKAATQIAALQARVDKTAHPEPAPGKPETANQVILHPETGTLTVRASHKDQQKVAEYLASVQSAALRQVLIEATVVEVTLGDQYQAGVDWSLLTDSRNWSLRQQLTSTRFNAASPVNIVGYAGGMFTATMTFLEQFGRTRVLSSPKVIALNNQTAVMKVVDQQVYFSLRIEEDKNENGVITNRTYTSEIRTVPVGLVMQVTPQIAESGVVTLSVRPTITKISSYVEDPAVAMLAATNNLNVKSLIPNLQVREFDSTLKVPSGQVAVLGGLIQDSQLNERNGVPGLSRLPVLGDLFSYRDDSVRKTELVIFLKPVAIRESGLDGQLAHLRQFAADRDFFERGEEHELSAFRSGNLPAENASIPVRLE